MGKAVTVFLAPFSYVSYHEMAREGSSNIPLASFGGRFDLGPFQFSTENAEPRH